jgi:hypothetical protein
MADTLPSPPPEKAVVVAHVNIGRLYTLTIISLTLNVVILVLLLAGAMAHHHAMMRERFDGPGMRGGGPGDRGPDREGRPFPRFGDGWRRGPEGDRGPGGPDGDFRRGPGAPPDPAKMTDAIMGHLTEKLALTDDEKAKIKPIVQQQVDELQQQREAQRTAMQKQFEDAKAKIKPLLTPDQQKQLDAMPVPGPGPNAGP